MGRLIDLTGQKFGRLTVIERDVNQKNKKGAYWKCLCECGKYKTVYGQALRTGLTQSCGCLNKEIISQPKDIQNMIGKEFGQLTVIERNGTHITSGGQKKVVWHCRCKCGNEVDVCSQDLKSGHTKSCGCISTHPRGCGLIDLTGRRFGKLMVLERAEDYTYINKKNGKVTNTPQWRCKCDCGNTIVAQGGNLRRGATTNCGCDRIISKGEQAIEEFLNKNKIPHLREYTFDDLRNKSGNLLRFDFGILNSNQELLMLVEYQGEQHYINCGDYGLYQRVYSDKKKKDYCTKNHIPLYEIKYNDDLEKALPLLLNEINSIEI